MINAHKKNSVLLTKRGSPPKKESETKQKPNSITACVWWGRVAFLSPLHIPYTAIPSTHRLQLAKNQDVRRPRHVPMRADFLGTFFFLSQKGCMHALERSPNSTLLH